MRTILIVLAILLLSAVTVASAVEVVVDWDALGWEDAKYEFITKGIVEREQDGISGLLVNLYPTSPYVIENGIEPKGYYLFRITNTNNYPVTVKAYIYADYINPEAIARIKDVNTNEPARAEYVNDDVVVIVVDLAPGQSREYHVTKADIIYAFPKSSDYITDAETYTFNASVNRTQNFVLPEQYRNVALSVYEPTVIHLFGREFVLDFPRHPLNVEKHGNVLAFFFEEPREYIVRIKPASLLDKLLFGDMVVE